MIGLIGLSRKHGYSEMPEAQPALPFELTLVGKKQ
jgi:hypothetical protein